MFITLDASASNASTSSLVVNNNLLVPVSSHNYKSSTIDYGIDMDSPESNAGRSKYSELLNLKNARNQ